MSAMGPGCVARTENAQNCFSLFSSFDGDCQSGSFLIQRNRDKLSTRKPDVGVFTQPGSLTEVSALLEHFRFTLISGHHQAWVRGPKCADSRHPGPAWKR